MQEKMKNTFRRLLSIVAAIAMAIGIVGGSTVPAMADDANPVTITIDNQHPNGGQENGPDYHWYVMMWASIGSGDNATAISYYVDKEDLAYALDQLTVDGKDLFKVDPVPTSTGMSRGHWNIVINNKTEAEGSTAAVPFSGEEVADALNSITNKDTLAEQTGDIQRSTDAKKTFNIANNGYVLVTSSLGSKMVLNTVKDGDTIHEKNDYPSVDKQQSKNQNGTYADANLSAQIGDTIYYHINVTIPATATKAIKVVDTMSEGLTMNRSLSYAVEGDGQTGTGSWTDITDSSSNLPAGSKVYSFDLSSDLINQITTQMKSRTETVTSRVLTISYSATVNSNAVKSDAPESNQAHIEYDNYVTPDDEVDVYSYRFRLLKYDAVSSTKTPLAGAHFKLFKKGANGQLTEVSLSKTSANDNAKYHVTDPNNANEATRREIVTDNTTTFEISGLDKNVTYYLRETKAPEGYNLLTQDIQVNYDNEGTGTAKLAGTEKDGEWGVANPLIEIANHQGSVLPSTGGIGTTVFYVLGGCLIAVAAVALIARKKRNA